MSNTQFVPQKTSEAPTIDAFDVSTALNLFEKLAYGQGKAAAGVVVNAVIRQYTESQLKSHRPDPHFTKAEIASMRSGSKLEAVKLVKMRTGKFLMDAKRYVETHGIKYLVESGKYRTDGSYKGV